MARENRDKMAHCRVTSTELKLIKEQARKLDLLPSEYMRLCVLNDIATRRQLAEQKEGV